MKILNKTNIHKIISVFLCTILLTACTTSTSVNTEKQTINKGLTTPETIDISGEVTEGITINSEKEVVVKLNNVSYSGENPFINIENAEKVTIEVTGENIIKVTGTEDAIYSKDDVIITGEGTLNINTKEDGIHVNDDLNIENVTLIINAENDGIDVNNKTEITNAEITVTAGDNGMSLGEDDNDNEENGFLVVNSSKIIITSEDDGIDATGDIETNNSEIEITAGGGSANAVISEKETFGGNFQPENSDFNSGEQPDFNPGSTPPNRNFEGSNADFRPQHSQRPKMGQTSDSQPENSYSNNLPETSKPGSEPLEKPSENGTNLSGAEQEIASGNTTGDPNVDFNMNDLVAGMKEIDKEFENSNSNNSENTEEETESSPKGIKGNNIKFTSTTLIIDSADDAVNADGSITWQTSTGTISCGDDAFHSENILTLESGTLIINKCREGFEAVQVIVNDGEYTINASDDGINATKGQVSGGNFSNDGSLITFNGGKTVIVVGNGDTDAVDSNGDIIVNNGTIDITSQFSAFDYNGTATYNGGTIIVNGETLKEIPNQEMGGFRGVR